jgi:hypothetical protein
MDKIITAFLFLSYQTRHFKNHYISMNNDPNVRFLYQFSFVLCSSFNVLMQWAEVIAKDFKNLNLIIGFGKMPPRSKFVLRWMKGLVIREYKIRKLDNLKYWLFHLKYIFDQNNLKISFIIILLIYDTLSE